MFAHYRHRTRIFTSGVAAFRFEVVTAGADTFQLPLVASGTYDFHVEWGDGTSDDITAHDDAAANHSYSGAGTFDVVITGTITGWQFNNLGDRNLVGDVSEWGPLNISMNGAFYGCQNMSVSATDSLTFSASSLESTFRNCDAITTMPNAGAWDITSATSLRFMFFSTGAINEDLDGWDTSNLTSLRATFSGANAFDQDLNSWDVSSVTNMQETFRSADIFNGNITSWDTGSATTFQLMFEDTIFDRDISGWDITSVTTMANMFLNGALSDANYDLLLVAWEAQAEQPNVTAHFGTAQYSAGAPAVARTALVANGWTITDGGAA